MCIRSCDALLSMLLDLGKCKPCCTCFVPWRHPDPHPDVVFSCKWFSHLNAYASTCALHPNEYPNLAGRWRSISNKAIQPEVQLAGTLLQISCCFASAAAATLVLAFVSVCRAAASAAAAAARHAGCVCSFFFPAQR